MFGLQAETLPAHEDELWPKPPCRRSYLHPVEYLLVGGHVLQQEPLQLLAELSRRQHLLGLNGLRAGVVRQDELQFLFRIEEMR